MTESACESVHRDLVRDGVLVPVVLGGAEERAWLDCDLASLAENRLGDFLDPRDLDDAHRARWLSVAVDEPPMSLAERSDYERCYWLVEGGQRVGTIALATRTLGNALLYVASFYVLPPHRRRGVGRRAMASLARALARHDLGLRLDTSWCWQGTVRFYLSVGLWVYMWKRELTLFWDGDTPPHHIEVGAQTASLSVPVDGSEILVLRAHRRGDALELEKSPPGLQDDKRLGMAYWHAHSTLALALALHGWPLIQSPEEWAESHYADGGAPEALAYKITTWEAYARKLGRVVSTPRIPGLAYPTWDEFQARWHAENAEIDLALAKK